MLEYAVGSSTVSISWSAYVVSLLHTFGINLPPQWIAGPFEAVKLPDGRMVQGYANLPAVLIVFLISMLLIIGIKESARTHAIVVVIKLAVVIVFIGMTSIGTLFAFVIVCAGVWVMRVKNSSVNRPFKTPLVPLIPILGIVWNFAMMYSLGWANWIRLVVWLAIGQAIYFGYGRKKSHLSLGKK